jgi:hypothetical protein
LDLQVVVALSAVSHMALIIQLSFLAMVSATSFASLALPQLTSHEESCYYVKDPADVTGKTTGAKGRSYRGLVTFTASSRACAKWSKSVNHMNESDTTWALETPTPDLELQDGLMHWGNGIGNHNYCRNPDQKFNKPWCFTVGGKKEECNIEECKPHRDFVIEADELASNMSSTDCKCATELYGSSMFLETARHMGHTKDGKPCRCN